LDGIEQLQVGRRSKAENGGRVVRKGSNKRLIQCLTVADPGGLREEFWDIDCSEAFGFGKHYMRQPGVVGVEQ